MTLDLTKLKRASKKDPIPGTVDKKLESPCPFCGERKLLKMKACCGAKNGYIWCQNCNYEKIL